MRIARLIARLVVGGLFFGHGAQKLFGWFGGPGLEKASDTMEALDLRPGRRNAILASASEAAGGAMVATGTLMPLAGAALIGSMVTAIRKVHFQKGLWNSDGGYELNLSLIAALLALVEAGPGSPSVDAALGIERSGNRWALAALAAGAAGSSLAVAIGERESERQERRRRAAAAAAAHDGHRPAPVGVGA